MRLDISKRKEPLLDKGRGINGTGEISGNLAGEGERNQRVAYTPGGGAMKEMAGDKAVEERDSAVISPERRCRQVPGDGSWWSAA